MAASSARSYLNHHRRKQDVAVGRQFESCRLGIDRAGARGPLRHHRAAPALSSVDDRATKPGTVMRQEVGGRRREGIGPIYRIGPIYLLPTRLPPADCLVYFSPYERH